MIIKRPFGAEDNDLNKAAGRIVTGYLKKIGEEIEFFKIYENGVVVETITGREFVVSPTERQVLGNRPHKPYLYMVECVDGRRKRIPKKEW